MRKEMEEIREKVHTTADAALFLCFQELNLTFPVRKTYVSASENIRFS